MKKGTLLSLIKRRLTKMKPVRKLILFIAVFLIVLLAVPTLLHHPLRPGKPGDAKFYFNNNLSTVSIGQSFTVELRVKTSRNAINAVGTTIQYPPRYLEIVKMSTEQSFCTFYTENSFNNNKGELNLSCGTPNPGFIGDTTLVKLTMRAKNYGNVKIELSKDSSILANDGNGTELANNHPALELKINQL